MRTHNSLSTKATIIIAAYNEAGVIRKTLQGLIKGDYLDLYQILVVCNGCTDNTEQIVRDEFNNVSCHSLTQASKALAIRYAESLNPGFPRLYLDADIGLSADDAASLISKARDQESAALIIPGSIITTDQSSALVKAYYRAWCETPYVREFGYGSGAYLINQQGRDRFDVWPELVADDTFIRQQFSLDETNIIQSLKVDVKAPKTLWSLIKIKARSKFGNLELDAYSTQARPHSRNIGTKKELNKEAQATPPLQWGDKAVYVLVNLAAFCLAKWQFTTGTKIWHRDDSNR